MIIKLIRTDSEDPCKIQLPLGDHVIGRGKLLECEDKRISRLHGKLSISDDSLTISALHQNPCFFITKGTTNTQILRQNKKMSLYNGDRFGLLPDAFWYEVLFCSSLESPKNCDSEKNTEEYCVENKDCNDTTTDESKCDKTKTGDSNSDDGCDKEMAELDSPSLIGTENNSPPKVLNNDFEPTCSTQNVSDETSKASEIDPNKEDKLQEPNESDLNVQNEPNQNDPNVQATPSNDEEQNKDTHSNKRSHSPDRGDVKKIKTESVEVKTENTDDVKPGPSLDQGQAAQQVNDGGAVAAGANNNPLRERCMYGANCYRKNPQHMVQYSHPRDADWGGGARGVCPYGAACRKTDPRHWRDHEHPPGHEPPPRPGMQIVRRHGNVFFIDAHTVNFFDDRFQAEDLDGDSVDFDYEF